MTFLKKLGAIVNAVSKALIGWGPAVAAFIPGDKDDKIIAAVSDPLAQIASIIGYAEVFGQALNLPGTQKLTAASPAVAQIILQSSLLAKRKIANETLFKAGCTQVTAGMADILNSLHEDGLKTEDKA